MIFFYIFLILGSIEGCSLFWLLKDVKIQVSFLPFYLEAKEVKWTFLFMPLNSLKYILKHIKYIQLYKKLSYYYQDFIISQTTSSDSSIIERNVSQTDIKYTTSLSDEK